jgi:putative nucleotidyltransferase with HDIG domain
MRHRRRPSGALLGAVTTLGAAGVLWGLDARRRSQRAALVHRTMVELLLNTLCAGDPETARHSRRVADLTDAVGRTYRLGRDGRARLRVGALLHDLGKLDDHVFPLVHSDRRLNESERSRMEDHSNQSADILQPLESIHAGISLIVESHHERWDGAGYPQGLSGPAIPLESRIISVADVFDAMTQPRSYREAMDAEEVLEVLRQDAGSRFDPEVVSHVGRPEVWREWLGIARAGRRDEEGVRQRSVGPAGEAEPAREGISGAAGPSSG